MKEVNKPAIIITVIMGIISVLAFIYLEVAGMFIMILWFLVPVLLKKLINVFKGKRK
ncbi:MAG: hypothetical protein KGY76_05665 [Candidatus Thermoplasmatota archaeon]|nr:hypothetical protein [Candidatus Thermoplasmatota archaeon]